MNPELIVASLLNVSGITALVGTKISLNQMSPNAKPPALVYQIIDALPMPNLNFTEPGMARARVQINPLALSIPEVKTILSAVRTALDFKHQSTVATKNVVSCRFNLLGPMDKDNETGIWTQSADFILQYYE
jgi:hypothetical protein